MPTFGYCISMKSFIIFNLDVFSSKTRYYWSCKSGSPSCQIFEFKIHPIPLQTILYIHQILWKILFEI